MSEKNENSWFSDLLLAWYADNGRQLPWRETKDPYKIWISEVVLQQTRVEQGLPYYLRFVERFPTVVDLAEASEDEVLKHWQGLGYYSRARNLHAAAKQISTDRQGNMPDTLPPWLTDCHTPPSTGTVTVYCRECSASTPQLTAHAGKKSLPNWGPNWSARASQANSTKV